MALYNLEVVQSSKTAIAPHPAITTLFTIRTLLINELCTAQYIPKWELKTCTYCCNRLYPFYTAGSTRVIAGLDPV